MIAIHKNEESKNPNFLLRLDDRQRMAESFVLDDRRVADTLVLAEEAIGKRVSLRSDLELAVRELIEINISTAQTVR